MIERYLNVSAHVFTVKIFYQKKIHPNNVDFLYPLIRFLRIDNTKIQYYKSPHKDEKYRWNCKQKTSFFNIREVTEFFLL